MRIAASVAACFLISLAWPTPSWSAPPGWPAALAIGTGSPGGTLIVYGGGLAAILTKALGMPVSVQATQGPDQNVLLLESGTVQLGFVTMGTALQAWNGTGEWTHDKKLCSMRALFPMYDTPFQALVLKNSGIHTFSDMADKRVSAGPHGSSGGNYAADFFKVLGIPVKVVYAAHNVLGAQMKSGQLDVVLGSTGLPNSTSTDLDTTEAVEYIPLNAGEIAKLRTALPEFTPSVVPAGTYPSLKSDYTTVGLFTFAVASKDLPDDLVYAIVKAFYANHGRMVQAHASARESVVANLNHNTFIPYHPGAIRYYREIGVDIPADLAAAQ
jgi:TRAP transporter TAXI family solute receptor